MVKTIVFGIIYTHSELEDQTLTHGTLGWPYYFDPVLVTLTYFSRSQVTFSGKFKEFHFTYLSNYYSYIQMALDLVIKLCF